RGTAGRVRIASSLGCGVQTSNESDLRATRRIFEISRVRLRTSYGERPLVYNSAFFDEPNPRRYRLLIRRISCLFRELPCTAFCFESFLSSLSPLLPCLPRPPQLSPVRSQFPV